MKRAGSKQKGTVKGVPSAVLLSILIHAGLFLLATLLVVFTVEQFKEPEFEAPKTVERPKMKLKKPKVRIKQNSKPKTTAKIVTRFNRDAMPVISMPGLGGMGTGLEAGIPMFEGFGELEEISLFGGGMSIGNDFVGRFYDFKRDREGSGKETHPTQFVGLVAKFIKNGWTPSVFAPFYCSPKKLYATCFMVPHVRSSVAPVAFGETDTGGWCWLAHYEGKLVYPEEITFRFRGQSDDILVVRVDGEVVLNACWPSGSEWRTEDVISSAARGWQSFDPDTRRYIMGNNTAVVGDWITLEPNVPLDMEVIIGEAPGGNYCSMLVVEVEGVKYPKGPQGNPILPMFKTTEPSHELCDKIYEWLVEGECSITNGPVFRDYTLDGQSSVTNAAESMPIPEPQAPDDNAMRTWSLADGRTLEAEYVITIGDQAALELAGGKQIRLPLKELSAEDRGYIDLSNPPEFKIDFTRKSEPRFIETSPYLNEPAPNVLLWTYGAKVHQNTSRPYPHPVSIEYYAIGQQHLDSSKYILMEKNSDTFIPTKENDRSHAFRGKPIELIVYDLNGQKRGYKPSDYLIILRDARGRIIQHESSSPWLFEHLENLEKLPQGAFFDKTCTRVYPTGPKRDY